MKDKYKILADENRRKIIKILLNGQLSVNEILSYFSIKQATLSSHLAVLLDAGLVSVSKKSKFRMYSVNKIGLEEFVKQFESDFQKNVKTGMDVDFVDIRNMSRR